MCSARSASARARRWRRSMSTTTPVPLPGARCTRTTRTASALAAWLQDDQLCEAIGVADEQPALFRLHNNSQREAFVAAMAAEVVRRLERGTAA